LLELLRLLKPVDLVLIEGFKRDPVPKIEIFRLANGKPPMHPEDPDIVGLISDAVDPSVRLPHASIDDDVAAAADLVLAHAEPLAAVLAAFAGRS
jgi:molybdopterin-guanine dinucleotide biosynthesis adapter protein